MWQWLSNMHTQIILVNWMCRKSREREREKRVRRRSFYISLACLWWMKSNYRTTKRGNLCKCYSNDYNMNDYYYISCWNSLALSLVSLFSLPFLESDWIEDDDKEGTNGMFALKLLQQNARFHVTFLFLIHLISCRDVLSDLTFMLL